MVGCWLVRPCVPPGDSSKHEFGYGGRRIFARLGPRKPKHRADADAVPNGVCARLGRALDSLVIVESYRYQIQCIPGFD
jgi:hypothetical protein